MTVGAGVTVRRHDARARDFRLLVVTVGALFVAFAALAGAFLWYENAVGWVMHTQQVRRGIGDVLQNLTEAESAQRGYIMTGDRQFARDAKASAQAARTDLAQLKMLTLDNSDQQRRIVDLGEAMIVRLAVLDRTLAARAAGNPVAAIRIIRQGRGLAAMREFRRLVSEFDDAEAVLEAQRRATTKAIRVGMLAALVVFAVVLTGLFVRAIRDLELERQVEEQTTRRLEGLLADRTLLIDEVNHRAKNSLQQIASVIRLQSRAVAHPEARAALERTLERIMAVGRVHEQLYKATETQDVGAFDAGAYVEGLTHELVNSMGRDDIALTTDIEAMWLDISQAVPLALVLNELITNALKYGCPEQQACHLDVHFRREGENCRLSITDQGPGLPKSFAAATSKSLGLKVVEALSRQLGGRLEIDQPEVGARFAVAFPHRVA